MQEPPVVGELEQLAIAYSNLDALQRSETSTETLLLVAEEAEFYGRELGNLATRLRGTARTVTQAVRMVV